MGEDFSPNRAKDPQFGPQLPKWTPPPMGPEPETDPSFPSKIPLSPLKVPRDDYGNPVLDPPDGPIRFYNKFDYLDYLQNWYDKYGPNRYYDYEPNLPPFVPTDQRSSGGNRSQGNSTLPGHPNPNKELGPTPYGPWMPEPGPGEQLPYAPSYGKKPFPRLPKFNKWPAL